MLETRMSMANPLSSSSGLSHDDAPAGESAGDENLAPGTRLGRYVVVELRGTDASGAVFAGHDPELHRNVTLKLLRPSGRGRPRAGPEGQLLQEAQALAKLAHPNVITVYDVGTWGDGVFVAMELVEGITLRQWLGQTKRRWHEVLDVMVPAGRGLAAAHAAELAHGNFKLENVLIGRDGRVRVSDFGLARPAHIAPAQHVGGPADAHSDQFSFCVALFEALFGVPPFGGVTAEPVTVPKHTRVPRWVQRHVCRGLSPDPQQRFATLDALLDALSHDPRQKRRRGLAAVGATTAVLASLGGLQYARTRGAAACRGAADRFRAVWDDERERRVGERVLAIDARMQTSWATAAAAIEAYGEAWVAMSTEACEATHVRGEQSQRLLHLRETCLQRRLDEVRAWSRLLAEPTQPMAARAAHAALGLDPVSSCADTEAFSSAVDPPSTAPLRAEVAVLRSELARVFVMSQLGLHDEAVAQALASYRAATSVDYPPVQAEARFRLGQAQGLHGDAEQATHHLEEAQWTSAAVRHDANAAAAACELVHVAAGRGAPPQDGLAWARHAEAALKRIGGDRFLQARLRHDSGTIHGFAGDFAQAAVDLERALKLYGSVPASELEQISATRGLARVRLRQRNLQVAESLLTQARARTVLALGPEHPDVAAADTGLAQVRDARGQHAEALELFRDALAQATRGYGPDDPGLAPLLEAQAESHRRHGEHGAAVEVERSLVRLRTRNLGDHPAVAAALHRLAQALERAEALDEARARHEEALAMWTATRPDGHPDLAFALTSLGRLDVRQGNLATGVRRLERAVALRSRRGSDPGLLAHAQFALAQALHAEHPDDPRARELATQARDGFSRGKSPDLAQARAVEGWLRATSSSVGGLTPAGLAEPRARAPSSTRAAPR